MKALFSGVRPFMAVEDIVLFIALGTIATLEGSLIRVASFMTRQVRFGSELFVAMRT